MSHNGLNINQWLNIEKQDSAHLVLGIFRQKSVVTDNLAQLHKIYTLEYYAGKRRNFQLTVCCFLVSDPKQSAHHF